MRITISDSTIVYSFHVPLTFQEILDLLVNRGNK